MVNVHCEEVALENKSGETVYLKKNLQFTPSTISYLPSETQTRCC